MSDGPEGSTAPYPIAMRPILKEKVWGGHRLAAWGKRGPAGERIGESWELADLAETSLEGGGGGAARSEIANGPLRGVTLSRAIAAWGNRFTGRLAIPPTGGFPILLKYLDADEELSVQVHPSASAASRDPEVDLKTECWYVLRAEPGARLYRGFREGVDRDRVVEAVARGEVPSLLRSFEASPGDCHDLPSGEIHALGAGILVAEVQTPSDTTYRLFDWNDRYDRPDRSLHVDHVLECVSFDPPAQPTRLADDAADGRLVRNEHYDVWEARLDPGDAAAHPDAAAADACTVAMVLDGTLATSDAPDADRFVRGTTVVLPASAAPLCCVDGPARVLWIGFPVG